MPRLRRDRRVWLIAGDVAQVYLALPFIDEVRRHHPASRFVVSVAARRIYRLAAAEMAAADVATYVPIPLSVILRRAMETVRPVSLVIVGQMIGHKLVWLARKRGVPVAWIAAEMSPATKARWNAFWERFDVDRSIDAIDVICANTAGDRARLVELGFRPDRIRVVGPSKFDGAGFRARSVSARAILRSAGLEDSQPMLLGGSTVDGEDEALLDAYATMRPRYPTLVLILAPRDLRRADALENEIVRRGLAPFRVSRRASVPRAGPRPNVVVIDTVGHLRSFYECASVVFMGRSLCGRTGSNLMEPAAHGRPIVVGPHCERFQEELGAFLSAGAVLQVADAGALQRAIAALLADAGMREAYGRRARAVIEANAGALGRTVCELERHGCFASGSGRPIAPP